jgi:hypothetical protein
MQEEITTRTDILDDNGHVVRPGWARDDLFNYDRSKIKVSPLRIKEWDFWEVFNSDYRIVLNIFDIGYAGVAQFTFTDFRTKKSVNAMMLKLFTKGSVGNPKSWRYDRPLRFVRGKSWMEFTRDGDNVILAAEFPDAMKKQGIRGRISLFVDPKTDAIVNLIPFQDPSHFVYAEKINCMPATGSFQIGTQTYEFSPANNSWGVLDWTRAVFPYKNHWKWCSASGKVDGVPFGFNLDYGFGTESSKNMLFYNNKGHHLDEISYQHDKKNLNAPLNITSTDNRVNLTLTPIYIEKAGVDLGILGMKGINTYGHFTGTVVLDDDNVIRIKETDRLFGWAEEFMQKW